MDLKITGTMSKEGNPQWPPKLRSLVVIEHNDIKNNLFVGSVFKHVLNGSASIIFLINNTDHTENIIAEKKLLENVQDVTNTKGLLLLVPTFGWRYVNEKKLREISEKIDVSSMQGEINKKYRELIQDNSEKKHLSKLVKVGPSVQKDLIAEAIYSDPSIDNPPNCRADDDFVDTSLLNERGELKMSELFKEKIVNKSMFNENEKFTQLNKTTMGALLAKINANETIPAEMQKIIVNKNIAVKNIIDSNEDEIEEGKKIIKWLSNNFINKKEYKNIKIFNDLKFNIFNGYVHIARKGLRVDDTITKKLIPNLNYFGWQYGVPIDYDTLKYTLFQSDFQSSIEKDRKQQEEAETILSQEYIIALQPEPRYQMWTLTRLIMAWYADDYLQFNIRKIKVIINQWRCRSDKDFNQKFGILPSILIYPRYGKISAKNVLSKISNYFLLYQSTGWKCATPSYFIKLNDLIWYSNGSIDLKLYFRKSLASYEGKINNRTFDDNYTGIISADKLLYPFKK